MDKLPTDQLADCRVVIVQSAAEEYANRLFIGLPDTENESPVTDGLMIAQQLLSRPEAMVPPIEPEAPKIDTVEFVPLFSDGDYTGFFEWLSVNGREPTAGAYERFFCEGTSDMEKSAGWDDVWQRNGLGTAVYTRALLFSTALSTGVRDKAVRTEYRVPAKLIEGMTAILEEKYGAGNVYVSPQIQPIQALIPLWHEFYIQARDRLVDGLGYRKGIYDEQELPANKLCAPLYGFTVSIRKDWSREIKVEEYVDFIKSFESTFLPHRELIELLDEEIPNISNLMLHLNSLLDAQNQVLMFVQAVNPKPRVASNGCDADMRKGGFRTWVRQMLSAKQ